MRDDVKRQWDWADAFLPEIKKILVNNSLHLIDIRIAPADKDLQEATDMIIEVKGGDIALRVREEKYLEFGDWTIRSVVPSGRTEIHKIKEGFADWYLYCWGDNGHIADWMLIDLDIVRNKGLLDNRKTKMNPDGITGFVYISREELRTNVCIVAEKADDI